MNKLNGYLWGFIFILIGIIWGLNAFDMIHINLFFKGWWTLFIIIPSFIGLISNQDRVGNLIGLVVGVFLFLVCRGVVDWDVAWKLVVPVIFVLIGISMIFKDNINFDRSKKIERSNMNEYYATFGSQRVDFQGQDLGDVSLNATFGELFCDFSKAKVNNDIVIDVSSVFGSIVVYVPEGIVVKNKTTSLFGKVSDNRKDKNIDGKKVISISGLCLFGGVEIR